MIFTLAMNKSRPKLPNAYLEQDLSGRLAYFDKEMKEVSELQQLLADMRQEEDYNSLSRAAGLQTNVNPITPRKHLKMRAHSNKILSMCAARTPASTRRPLLGTLSQDNTVVIWDEASGLKTDAFRVSQGHTLAIATPPTARIAAVGGLSCTIDLFSINDRLCSLLNEHREPYPIKETHSSYIESEGVRLFRGVAPGTPSSAQEPARSNAPGRNTRHLGTLYGHKTAVTCLEFIDEYILGSGAADGSCAMWDALTGEPIMRSYEHLATVSDLSPNPASRFVMASAADDGQLKVWDSRQSRSVMTFPATGNYPLNGLQFHPEGQSIVAASRDAVLVCDIRTNCTVSNTQNFAMPTAMTLSESGRLAVLGYTNGIICVLDVLKGAWVGQHRAHRDRVSGLAVFGSEIASCSWDTTAATWKCL